MSQRNCIYTGLPAKTTDKVVPKNGGDESHNWANSVPCSEEYKQIKQRREPNDLELEANKIFKMLELARLEVEALQGRLKENQIKILKQCGLENPIFKRKKKISKNKEIEMAYKDKELSEVNLDKVVEEKKKKLKW